jgi:hypothetical protein
MAPSPLYNIAGIGYYVSSECQHLRLAPKAGSCDDAIAVRNVDKTPKERIVGHCGTPSAASFLHVVTMKEIASNLIALGPK